MHERPEFTVRLGGLYRDQCGMRVEAIKALGEGYWLCRQLDPPWLGEEDELHEEDLLGPWTSPSQQDEELIRWRESQLAECGRDLDWARADIRLRHLGAALARQIFKLDDRHPVWVSETECAMAGPRRSVERLPGSLALTVPGPVLRSLLEALGADVSDLEEDAAALSQVLGAP